MGGCIHSPRGHTPLSFQDGVNNRPARNLRELTVTALELPSLALDTQGNAMMPTQDLSRLAIDKISHATFFRVYPNSSVTTGRPTVTKIDLPDYSLTNAAIWRSQVRMSSFVSISVSRSSVIFDTASVFSQVFALFTLLFFDGLSRAFHCSSD